MHTFSLSCTDHDSNGVSQVPILTSIVLGVALLAVGAGGWIWANIQGGFGTPVLHRSPPLPVLTVLFFYVMIVGPSVFALAYPAIRAGFARRQVAVRVLAVLCGVAVIALDVLSLVAYQKWVYRTQ